MLNTRRAKAFSSPHMVLWQEQSRFVCRVAPNETGQHTRRWTKKYCIGPLLSHWRVHQFLALTIYLHSVITACRDFVPKKKKKSQEGAKTLFRDAYNYCWCLNMAPFIILDSSLVYGCRRQPKAAVRKTKSNDLAIQWKEVIERLFWITTSAFIFLTHASRGWMMPTVWGVPAMLHWGPFK